MIAVYLPPYPFRGLTAPYLWLFFKFLHSARDKILFITGDDYLTILSDPDRQHRWEFDPASMASLGYTLVEREDIVRHEYLYLDSALYPVLLERYNNDPIKAFSAFLTERIPELEVELTTLLQSKEGISKSVDAFISICNCPSLEYVARTLGKEVLHIELGPLRAPMYRNTAYLDFSGVNGRTEARSRYEKCCSDLTIDASLEDLHKYFLEALIPDNPGTGNAAGVVLQVEDDSNLIAYSNGFTNNSIIAYARQRYLQDDILVRAHPGSLFRLRDGAYNIDGSPNSLEFIAQCKDVFTINSSVGLESILVGKNTTILGDCSYGFVNEIVEEQHRVNAMAFYLFAYLIPFDLAFDQEYLHFRLSNPQDKAIVNKHLAFYSQEQLDDISAELCSISSLINKTIIQDKTMRKILENTLLENNKQFELLKEQLAEEASEREKLTHTINQLRKEIEATQLNKSHVITALEAKQDEINRMRNSLSWKLTMPVRMSGRICRGEFSTIKTMIREHRTSGSNRVSRFILSGGLLSKSKYKTALRLIISGNWAGIVDGLKRVMNRAAADSTPTTIDIDNGDVKILATQHTLFVAHLIEKNLRENGVLAQVRTAYTAEHDHGQLHFVVCPQMFPQLPKQYIAFQMEQSVNSRWFTEDYFSRLNNAVAIFDYSLQNIEYLLNSGIPYNKLFYMPISSYANYPAYLQEIGYDLNDRKDDKKAKVLFYGDPNCERRKAYLQELRKHFNVTIASEVFGDRLTKIVKDARVVINIHYYEDALLETTRLYETLSLGTPIVSESSADIDEHSDLQGVIDFCPVGDIQAMVEAVQKLLSDENGYSDKRAKITQFISEDQKNNIYLKRYLLSVDKLSLEQYESKFSFDDIKENDIPRLCLSLSETPVRRKAFFKSPSHGFQFFDGIRYRIGWIGCGMSYKYMLSGMLASKAELGIICEDDVIFPLDYDSKLNKIIDHLKTADTKWHIFAGIIAHLHDDTKILDVREIDGIEYVYIDKMTSMVMNIYSRIGMELISNWNEKNIDAEVNTIDRYVESTENLVVVTTVPFLVGYAEEQQSTLWGFENSQYTSLIKASETLLAEKVAAFKRSRA